MNLDLTGKHAVVCGSTQGIGKATAIELALLGATVTLMARNEEKMKSTLKELSSHAGQEHSYLVADFSVTEKVKSQIEGLLKRHVVHVLVNNTGGPPGGLAIDAKLEEFTQAFSNHLICNQILVQACLDGMKKEKYGRIINIISTSVKTPRPGLGVSNTIRGAVANWAKTLSMELGPYGVTVNNVLPGAIMTARLESLITSQSESSGKSKDEVKKAMEAEVPLRRIGDIKEIAAAVAFLSTPAASYISGINVPVDGGRTACL
jgi:3-oxoacyl-[acyl-carrier protein] reductase